MKRLASACVVLGLVALVLVALAGCRGETPQKKSVPPKAPASASTPGAAAGSAAPDSTGVVPAKPAEDKPASASAGSGQDTGGPRGGRGGARSSPGPRAGDARAGNAGAGQHTEEIQAVVEKKLPDDSKPDDGKSPPAKP